MKPVISMCGSATLVRDSRGTYTVEEGSAVLRRGRNLNGILSFCESRNIKFSSREISESLNSPRFAAGGTRGVLNHIRDVRAINESLGEDGSDSQDDEDRMDPPASPEYPEKDKDEKEEPKSFEDELEDKVEDLTDDEFEAVMDEVESGVEEIEKDFPEERSLVQESVIRARKRRFVTAVVEGKLADRVRFGIYNK